MGAPGSGSGIPELRRPPLRLTVDELPTDDVSRDGPLPTSPLNVVVTSVCATPSLPTDSSVTPVETRHPCDPTTHHSSPDSHWF